MSKIVQLASLSSLVLSACLITACSDGDKNDADHTLKSGYTLVSQVETSNPNIKFSIDIQNNTCSDKPKNAIGSVSWDATAAGVNHVKVMAGKSVFADVGGKGQQLTGPWINQDSALTLVDANTGKNLATLKIGTQACKF